MISIPKKRPLRKRKFMFVSPSCFGGALFEYFCIPQLMGKCFIQGTNFDGNFCDTKKSLILVKSRKKNLPLVSFSNTMGSKKIYQVRFDCGDCKDVDKQDFRGGLLAGGWSSPDASLCSGRVGWNACPRSCRPNPRHPSVQSRVAMDRRTCQSQSCTRWKKSQNKKSLLRKFEFKFPKKAWTKAIKLISFGWGHFEWPRVWNP